MKARKFIENLAVKCARQKERRIRADAISVQMERQVETLNRYIDEDREIKTKNQIEITKLVDILMVVRHGLPFWFNESDERAGTLRAAIARYDEWLSQNQGN